MNFKDTGLYISILLILSLVCGQNHEQNAAINEIQLTIENDTSKSTLTPLEIICNHTETCQLYDKIKIGEDKYRDLRTRKCMCDEECPRYGDCCKDSTYYNTPSLEISPFTCERTVFDDYIYMVTKCAPDYTNNSRVIEKCLTTNRTILVRNFLLRLPVTNVLTKITYKNAFCAICNFELNFDFWQPVFQFEFEKHDVDIIAQNTSEPTRSDKTRNEVVDGNAVLQNMKLDENRDELISQVDGSTYLCNMIPDVPAKVASAIRYCLSPLNDRSCSDCEKRTPTNSCIADINFDYSKILLLDESTTYLPKIDSCNDVPANISNRDIFCPPIMKINKPIPLPSDIEGCFFKNTENNRECLVSTFYAPEEYQFLEDGSVYIKVYDYAFPPDEYTNKTSIPNIIYVCGTEIPMSKKNKMLSNIREVLTETLIKFSIFFLILYLATNADKQKLQSLPNKNLFSFCLTLLLLYSVFEMGQVLSSCKITAALFHYLSLSAYTWSLVIFYDFWKIICRSSVKIENLANKTHLKRYLLYCFIGWISPLSIMAVSIFFELSPRDTIACPYKPGYGRLKQCFIAQYYAKLYLFLYPTFALFFVTVALFARTSYHIYITKRENIKSIAQNNYYTLFIKFALTIGLSWAMSILVTFTDLNLFKFLYVISYASLGIQMFFVYGFKETWLTKMCYNHKNYSIAQQTKSIFFNITDRIKRPRASTSINHHPIPTQELQCTM